MKFKGTALLWMSLLVLMFGNWSHGEDETEHQIKWYSDIEPRVANHAGIEAAAAAVCHEPRLHLLHLDEEEYLSG